VSGALQGSLYAFVLVSAPSLRMLWRLRESLLALPPLVLALAWTIGLMHLFGIRFNLANIWSLPMILGISAEFGLNVMFRYLEGRAYGGPRLGAGRGAQRAHHDCGLRQCAHRGASRDGLDPV